ncbi:uncharacterized protein BCR38DRAFT_414568 [Pseudomassariella vexata]|uniref:Uncharacterized protein n=1 Tax=Pseudomassariella vexata TaxID=1141098 RepID=A0A1Y2DBC1_9PEZI|nr:uncharacterized protein BCR38DRAFT_414568 [Pseudomassariella vexata]ORY56416.1 hypothetical protein BCR38DRAFT_414568 [Pseudomassariella vexata]
MTRRDRPLMVSARRITPWRVGVVGVAAPQPRCEVKSRDGRRWDGNLQKAVRHAATRASGETMTTWHRRMMVIGPSRVLLWPRTRERPLLGFGPVVEYTEVTKRQGLFSGEHGGFAAVSASVCDQQLELNLEKLAKTRAEQQPQFKRRQGIF